MRLLDRLRPVAPTLGPYDLPWGRDELGRPTVFPLGKAHMLIAGATGRGKSSVFRAVVGHAAPLEHVQLVGIDLKRQEFGRIRPRLAMLATEPEHAQQVIDGVVALMMMRTIISEALDWEEWRPSRHHPYLGLLIDELAELMLVHPEGRKVLQRVLQLGRSLGINVIGAMQRAEAMGDSSIGATTRDQFNWRFVLPSNSAESYKMGLGYDPDKAMVADLGNVPKGSGIWHEPESPDRLARAEWWPKELIAERVVATAHLTIPFGQILTDAHAASTELARRAA